MNKNKKYIPIILSGVVVATNTQLITLSYALDTNLTKTTSEKSIKRSMIVEQEIDMVEVETEEDLIASLENPSVKVIDIKNNIELTNDESINVYGESKEIKGNGHTVSYNNELYDLSQINIDSVKYIKIDKLNFNGVDIRIENSNLDILNNSKISNSNIEAYSNSKVQLENSDIENTEMRDMGGFNTIEVRGAELNNSSIFMCVGSIKDVKIKGKKATARWNTPLNIGFNKDGYQVELKNITISNPGDYGIVSSSKNVMLSGEIEIEGANKEAILVTAGSKDAPNELYIEGNIKQKGNTYTIKAEKEGRYTKVYDSNNILKRGLNESGDAYYNTNNRIGEEPKLPNFEITENVEVKTEEDLIASLENPNIKVIDIKSNIELTNDGVINIYGESKEIKGNGHTVSCANELYDLKEINIGSDRYIKVDNLNFNEVDIRIENSKLNILNNSKISNTNIEAYSNAKLQLENSNIENTEIRDMGGFNTIEVKGLEINDSSIYMCVGSIKDVKIKGKKATDRWNTPLNIGKNKDGYQVELKNITISNPGDYGIVSSSKNVMLSGEIEIEGANKEAILVTAGSKDAPNELHIEGNIKQKGNTYAIKAEKEGVYTKVYDKNNILKKGTNLSGDTFYIHKDRDDIEVPNPINYVTNTSTKIFGYAEPNQKVRVKSRLDSRTTDIIGEDEADNNGKYEINLNGKELKEGTILDIYTVNESNESKVLSIDVKNKKEDTVQNKIDDKTSTIIGTSNPGTTIIVKIKDTIIRKIVVDEFGAYSIEIPTQSSGTVINISFIDEEGNETANYNKIVQSTSTSTGGSSGSIVISPSVTESKLVGEDRYKTAIEVSNKGWSNSENIVIVNSSAIVDALSATPFAKMKNAPILLTESDQLNNETQKEIIRLGAKNVYVIGGTGVVSENVISQLKAMNLNVDRISGDDRYSTSLEIAKRLGNISEIAVVNGVTGLADAVSIAPVAANRNMPIVLSSPNEGTKTFDEFIKSNNIKTSYVIGREAAISEDIASKLPNSSRLGGLNRNETNAIILEKFYTNKDLNNIFVAKDGMKKVDDLIDALAVGALASKENSPVVIVGDKLETKQEKLLKSKNPKEITQVGGNGNENAFSQIVNIFKK